jgi:hypothetical protein
MSSSVTPHLLGNPCTYTMAERNKADAQALPTSRQPPGGIGSQIRIGRLVSCYTLATSPHLIAG